MALLLPACGGQVESGDGMPALYSQAVGNWSGTHKVMGNDQEFNASYKVYVDGENLIHEFTSDFGGGFTGRESLHSHGTELHATWTDSHESGEMESSGTYDAASKILIMSGKGPDWQDPAKTVTFRHVTEYGDNTSKYTMFMIDDQGNESEVMWINMTKDSE